MPRAQRTFKTSNTVNTQRATGRFRATAVAVHSLSSNRSHKVMNEVQVNYGFTALSITGRRNRNKTMGNVNRVTVFDFNSTGRDSRIV